MSRLRERKTKLKFITNATVRYRGKDRDVVIEARPDSAIIRLLGTRVKYEVPWRSVHDMGARIAAAQKQDPRRVFGWKRRRA